LDINLNKSELISKLSLFLPAIALIGSAISWGDFYLFHIYAWLLFSLLLITPSAIKNLISFNLKNNKIWLTVLAYATISVAWTQNLSEGLKYLGYLYSGFFLIFTIPFFLDTDKKKSFVMKTLLYVFIAHILISMLEILTPFRWPLSQYSSFLPYFNRSIIPGYEQFEGYPTGIFWHQNNSALVTLVAIPFLFKIKNMWLRILLIVLSFFCILASGSKAIMLLSLGYLAYKIITLKAINFKMKGASVLILLLCLGLAPFLLSQEQTKELSQSVETVRGYVQPLPEFCKSQLLNEEFDFQTLHPNIRERFYFMAGGIDLYRKHPVIGVGSGSHFSQVYKKDGSEFPLKAMHNYWLEVLILFGPIILLLYLLWFGRNLSEPVALLALGIPVLSTAAYFIPGWLLVAIVQMKKHGSNNE
jgi:teichuronic acid biosynthesis protein TuaE